MVRSDAATVPGLAAGFACWICLAGISAFADEPPAKSPDPTPPQIKSQEPSKPEKPAEKSPESKPPDAKGSESKTPAAPTPTTKPPEPKSTPESKPTPPAAPGKAGNGKTAEGKGSDEKHESPPDAKPPEVKAPEPPKTHGPPILSIKLALMADPRLFPYELDVDMNGDVAVLSGKVGSDQEKAVAAEIATKIEGVSAVKNEIEIVKDLPQTLARKKDDLITQYVKERFGKSKTLEAAAFDIKTENGIVTLSGKTKFLVIALEAAEAARHVPGVKAVRSEGVRLEAAD